jgi:putative membrane protein
MLKKIKLYTGLVLLAIVLIVVFQNTQTVETKFLFMTMTMPRAALLAITMLIGVFIGILISLALLGKNSQKD